MSEVVTSAVNRTLLAGDDFKSLIEEKMDDPEDAQQRKTAETCFHEFVSMPYYYIFMEKLFGLVNWRSFNAKTKLLKVAITK